MKFINRKSELKALDKEYKREGSSFVVIYGRRRVGKTTLIKEFIKDKKAIYFLAELQNEITQLEKFKNIIIENFHNISSIEINTWDLFFDYLAKKSDKIDEKLIIVIDEFQYLAQINKAIPSIFQYNWDEKLQNKNIMLILCGSLISMIYDTVLNYNSPLYGRRTSQIKLAPLKFKDYKEFFKGLDNETIINFYSITNGIPKYIEFIDKNKSIYENIRENILNKNSFLYIEPKFVLKEEIKDTITYFSILQIISQGEHKIGNIASKLGIQTNKLIILLDKLRELEILERIVPITEENPSKSKKKLYFIKDNFFRFWFRYVFPYQSYLEIEEINYVLNKKIKMDFHLFVSSIFEKICRDLTFSQQKIFIKDFEILKIGKWWNKNQEIDIIALGENDILFGECKWWKNKVGVNILDNLKEKSKYVKWKNTKNTIRKEYFAIYSKSDFTIELKEIASKNENIFLHSIKDF